MCIYTSTFWFSSISGYWWLSDLVFVVFVCFHIIDQPREKMDWNWKVNIKRPYSIPLIKYDFLGLWSKYISKFRKFHHDRCLLKVIEYRHPRNINSSNFYGTLYWESWYLVSCKGKFVSYLKFGKDKFGHGSKFHSKFLVQSIDLLIHPLDRFNIPTNLKTLQHSSG